MAIENPKEILDYLGTPDVESLDDFKEKFNSKFVPNDPQAIVDNKPLYSQVVGKLNGANKGKLNRVLKSAGFDVSLNDFDEDHIGDIIEKKLPDFFNKLNTKIATLEESAGKGVNEKVQAVQSEYEKYKTEVAPKIQEYDKLAGEFESFKQTVAQKEVKEKINKYEEEEWGKFGFSQTIDPYTKKGFVAEVDSKFQSKLFDDGVYPVDEKGNRIPDPSRAGAWKSKSQLAIELADEAEKKGARLRAKVEQGKGQPEVKKTFTFKAVEDKDQPQGRKINTGTRVKTAA